MVSPDGGERSAAVPCFSLYVNQSSCCLCDGFHWGGNIQSSEFTHIFFMGIFANEKGTGFDARSFFERLYQCQKIIQLTMDNKKYDLLLFKIKGISCSPKFIHIFFGGDVFFGVSFNFMQVMTCDMGTSPGHRRGGLIFCILRGLSSPPHRHISRYLYFNS